MSKKKVKAKARATKAETPENRRKRATKILTELRKIYPEADCALEHKSPWELLVSTILSAQCTDKRVNMVTPSLFARYKTIKDLAVAKQQELEGLIKSTGFYRNKAKNIIGAAQVLAERYAEKVPDTMAALVELPGVARKTANVLLGTWFKKNEGFVVDTHIGRLSHRLGLTWRSKDDKDAVKIELDLMDVFPQESWTFAGHALISHGREVCAARKPACERCVLADQCPSAFTFGDESSPKPAGKASGKRPRQ